MPTASYLNLLNSGELHQRIKHAERHSFACCLCGWQCQADRASGPLGKCCSGIDAMVSAYHPHMGEESPLTGTHGSGTIFFSGCNLRCLYCQNHEISQDREGRLVTPAELAQMMLHLQAKGCHNINLVSPTHYLIPILKAVLIAAKNGLKLPLVYNTGGYDSLEGLILLENIVDIYMPDMKYSDESLARNYSKVPNYPSVNQKAVMEMHRQVGDLVMDAQGIAVRGLIIRHLVLPDNIAGTEKIVKFISEHISKNTYLNIMDQYHPAYTAYLDSQLHRRITRLEYTQAIQLAKDHGLNRISE